MAWWEMWASGKYLLLSCDASYNEYHPHLPSGHAGHNILSGLLLDVFQNVIDIYLTVVVFFLFHDECRRSNCLERSSCSQNAACTVVTKNQSTVIPHWPFIVNCNTNQRWTSRQEGQNQTFLPMLIKWEVDVIYLNLAAVLNFMNSNRANSLCGWNHEGRVE